MKVDEPRSKLSKLIIFLKKLKKSGNYEGSDSNKNESFCSKDDVVGEGLEGEIYENERQQEASLRLKKKIRQKIRSYYDA